MEISGPWKYLYLALHKLCHICESSIHAYEHMYNLSKICDPCGTGKFKDIEQIGPTHTWTCLHSGTCKHLFTPFCATQGISMNQLSVIFICWNLYNMNTVFSRVNWMCTVMLNVCDRTLTFCQKNITPMCKLAASILCAVLCFIRPLFFKKTIISDIPHRSYKIGSKSGLAKRKNSSGDYKDSVPCRNPQRQTHSYFSSHVVYNSMQRSTMQL